MMSDDLGDKIQQIIQMLGQDEAPNKLKDVVAVLATALGSNEGSSDDTIPSGNEKADNTELISAAKRALERVNSSNDPRVNLLQAIKPFMNNKRQNKISNCIQLLQVASLRSLLTDKEKEVR